MYGLFKKAVTVFLLLWLLSPGMAAPNVSAQQDRTSVQSPGTSTFTVELLNTNGVPYPGVTVLLTNQATGERFLRMTSKNGEAVFTDLPDGNYRWDVKTQVWVIIKSHLSIGTQGIGRKIVLDLSTGGPHGMPVFCPTSEWLKFADKRDPQWAEFIERREYGELEPQPAADATSENQTQKKEQETQQENSLAEGETDLPTAPASDSKPVGSPFKSYDFLLEEGAELLGKLRVDLQKGFDPNQPDASGKTVLMLAAAASASKDLSEFVKLLLSAGADPNAKDPFGDTALMVAARRGNEKVARLLLQAGADPNAKNQFGVTAIHHAADSLTTNFLIHLSREFIRLQTEVDASDDNGRTPLMISAFSGNLEATLVLIEAGADINARDKQGNSVLTYAIEGAVAGFGQKDNGRLIVQRLKKAGAVE